MASSGNGGHIRTYGDPVFSFHSLTELAYMSICEQKCNIDIHPVLGSESQALFLSYITVDGMNKE